jgi:hypothetical protein
MKKETYGNHTAGIQWKPSGWQPMETIQLATNGIHPAGNHCLSFGLHLMETGKYPFGNQ